MNGLPFAVEPNQFFFRRLCCTLFQSDLYDFDWRVLRTPHSTRPVNGINKSHVGCDDRIELVFRG
jgi:hypothetical protein